MNSAVAQPIAKARILIRHNINEVFEAFVDPAQLTKFWLSKSSGRLEVGKKVQWDFMVEGARVGTEVVQLEKNKTLRIKWDEESTVVFSFEQVPDGVIVDVQNFGFQGDQGEQIQTAIESTQGFTIVLCDLKTLLERGTSAQLVKDKAALIEHEIKNSKK